MTVPVAQAARLVRQLRGESLVKWADAAARLATSPRQLGAWAAEIGIPVVRTPGGQRCTYESWLDMVLASPAPGAPGCMEQVTRCWWAERSEKVA